MSKDNDPGLVSRGLSVLFEMEPVPISSSEIRGHVALGAPIDELVPEPVAREIERRHLYAPDPGYSGAA